MYIYYIRYISDIIYQIIPFLIFRLICLQLLNISLYLNNKLKVQNIEVNNYKTLILSL